MTFFNILLQILMNVHVRTMADVKNNVLTILGDTTVDALLVMDYLMMAFHVKVTKFDVVFI